MPLNIPAVHTSAARRAVVGALGVGLLAGATFVTAPTALADHPNCTFADLAGVAAGVSAATAAYMFTHPDVNAFMTGLKGQPRDDIRAEVQRYLDAHPQTRAEIMAIRQPLADIRNRCDVDDVPMP